MPQAQLTDLLGWCSLINGLLLLVSSLYLSQAGNQAYQIQRRLFAITRDQFTVLAYGFLGLYKLLWLVFNIVPYLALKLIA